MNAIIRCALVFFLSITSIYADEAAWPGLKFTEVRAYAWPNELNSHRVILADMKREKGAINPSGALLTPQQTKTLIASINGKRPGYPVGMCHLPHNAFVFFDANKKPVAYVEVCFKCQTHVASPAGANPSIDLAAIAGIFEAHRLPLGEYPNADAFKKSFDELIKQASALDNQPTVPSKNVDPFE